MWGYCTHFESWDTATTAARSGTHAQDSERYLRTGEREATPDGGPDELRRPHASRPPPVVAEVRPVERLEVAIHSLPKGWGIQQRRPERHDVYNCLYGIEW